MDELRYRVDLLDAMNQKLTGEEKMYRIICDMPGSAFLHVNFPENQVRILGDWNLFFPNVEIKDGKDVARLYVRAEEKYVVPFRDILFPEKAQKKDGGGIIRLKDTGMWVECTFSVLYDEDGNATDKVIRFKDISKLKDQNEDLAYLAYYDSPTGLYNKNYFIRLLTDYLKRAEEENVVVSLLSLQVSGLRQQKEGLELLAGEEGLEQFGQYLSSLQGENVLTAYLNTDVFGIAIYDPRGNRTVENICGQIKERLKTPFTLSSGQELVLTVSVGVAEYPEAGDEPLSLIRHGETVMQKARKRGRNIVEYFDDTISDKFTKNLQIENELKKALPELHFHLHFQPQFDVKERKMRGMEALVRWQGADGKPVSPSDFIPIAEKKGAMAQIDAWVMEESIRIFGTWKKKYDCDCILSLNISADQYIQDGFTDRILSILKKYAVEPEKLELEITETMLFEGFEAITEKIGVLRDYGIRISLDDFGSGYSSLSCLRKLPADTIKIDQSLTGAVATDKNACIIVESVIGLAGKLGFETIAEGVEREEQLDKLKELGCGYVQGYLLGMPMPEEEMEQLLRG